MERKRKYTYTPLHACVMKTAVFMTHVALFTGCSNAPEDLVPDQLHAVSFGVGEKTEEVTRAGSQNSSKATGISELAVYGYKTADGAMQNVMPGYTLKYTDGSDGSSTSNSSGWEYVGQGTDYLGLAQEIKYWDGNTADYRFFGVLPAFKDRLKYDGKAVGTGSGEAFETEKTPSTTGSFSLTLDLSCLKHTADGKYYDQDGTEVKEEELPMYGALWQGDPSANYDKPVTLQLVKPHALVSLVFLRPVGTSTTVLGKTGDTSHPTTFGPKSSSESLAGSGTATVTYPMTGDSEKVTVEQTSASTLQTMTFDPLTITEQETRYAASPEYLMIPASTTNPNGDFECKTYIYVKNGTTDNFYERKATVPATYVQWRAGYKYIYVFKITMNNSLEFSHVVETYTKWQAGYADHVTW